jgi:DNA-3-methyladenine glycosylase I
MATTPTTTAKTTAKTPPIRCGWARGSAAYLEYHDDEWGRPVHDDRRFFEMLVLEGAQAGLSWSTILNKRAAYRVAFDRFEPARVARFDAARRRKLMADAGIVRNRLKIESAVRNAKAFLAVQGEFGSFDDYVWRFVDGRPLVVARAALRDVPPRTAESDALSKDLKKRGMNFVGTTIVYAFMQATGLVNDHVRDCFLAPRLVAARSRRRP